MKRTQHAEEMAQRFRELVESAGDTLTEDHYKELALIIEAGIDTVMIETLEKMADQLNKMSHEVRNNAEYFD